MSGINRSTKTGEKTFAVCRRTAASFNKITGPNAGGPRQFPIRTPLAARVGQFPSGHTLINEQEQIMIHVSRRDFLKIAGTSAAASALTSSCASRAPTVLLPDKVAYVCGCKPDAHNPGGGGDSTLFIGNYCRNSERFLLHWNLSGLSFKPKINEAVMGLYCVEIHGTPSGRLIYAPLTSDWGETVTYNTQPKNEADRQVSMEWPAKGNWQKVDITGIVTQWLATPKNNYGLIGYAVDVSEETCSAVFASIRMPEGMRPKLTIT